MSFLVSCRIKPYIQPFERRLALEELATLSGGIPLPEATLDDSAEVFHLTSLMAPKTLARELAYWETVSTNQTITTTQILRESTVSVVRNGVAFEEIDLKLPFKGTVPFPNRRCLRYASHGLHEYRGKFFPQLVLALLNIGDVRPNGVVADPFCGSGTTAEWVSNYSVRSYV